MALSLSISKLMSGFDTWLHPCSVHLPSSHHLTACIAGLGWANLAGAVFNCFPTTGSFARSAVAKYTGAKSGLAGVVTAGLVGITLLFLTQVFNAMPMNALAAIVIAGVLPLLDFGRGISLFWVGLQT